MTKNDIIFAIICGLSVAWIGVDFFGDYGLILFLIFPALSVLGLWIVELIGRKYLFVHQFGKFGLAGALASVVDIKVFQLLFLFLPFSLACKAISFFIAAIVKYLSDKYWTFQKNEKKNMHIEMLKFFGVVATGSLLNVASFYFFSKIKVGLPFKTWQEASIIFAILITAIWNFVGYKFIVFKK